MKRLILAVLFILPVLAGTCYSQDAALAETAITITYPEQNAEVALNEIIEGDSQNISEDYRLWIIVYPRSVNRYYFQDFSPNFIGTTGDWSSSAVIGDAASSGQKFDVYVALANPEANTFIEDHLAECRRNNSWPGLTELPAGTTLMDKVTVTRA